MSEQDREQQDGTEQPAGETAPLVEDVQEPPREPVSEPGERVSQQRHAVRALARGQGEGGTSAGTVEDINDVESWWLRIRQASLRLSPRRKRLTIPVFAALVTVISVSYTYLQPQEPAVVTDAELGGSLLLVIAWGAVINLRAFADSKFTPPTQERLQKRLRKAVISHRAVLLLAASGALLLVSESAESPVFRVTAFVLAVGVFLKTATRTRKVATAFYLAAGEALESSPVDEPAKRRAALDKCYASGSSGIDTGFFRDWWAVPVLHPDVLADLAAACNDPSEALSANLLESLAWTRAALRLQLDVGA